MNESNIQKMKNTIFKIISNNNIVVYRSLFCFQVQTWSFTPRAEEKYVMKPNLIVWGQGFSSTSSGGKKKQFTVRALGEGSLGDIKVCNT